MSTQLLFAAILVFVGETLSALHCLGSGRCWLAASALFAVVAFFVPRRERSIGPAFTERLRGATWAWRFMAAAYLGIFLVALLLPPNTWDAMSYHLARVGYYLQYGSLNHFSTNNPRQVEFPSNAEVVLLWTLVFPRCDVLAGLVQFSAAIGCAISVYGIAPALGLTRGFAALCPLLLLGLPEIGLQASSTQNDLFAAWLVASAVYFALRDAQNPSHATAWLTAIAAGLAAGTKPTAWLFAPGIALLWLAAARARGSLALRPAARIATLYVLCVTFFAGPHILRNYVATGRAISLEPGVRVESLSIQTIAANALRLGADLCEANDLPYPLNRAFGVLKHKAGSAVFGDFNGINPPAATFPGTRFEFKGNILEEDVSWFGCAGCLLWLGAFLGMVFCRRNRWVYRSYLCLPFGFFIFYVLMLRWQPWAGRLFVPATVLIVPAGVVGIRLATRGLSRGVKRFGWNALAALAVCGAFSVLIQNELKPLLPRANLPSVFSLTRNQQRCRHRPYNEAIVTALSKLNPSRVGFAGDMDQWDYLAFVNGFKHFIIRYDANVDVAQAFDRDGCDVLLIQNNYAHSTIPAGFAAEVLNDYWSLIRRKQ